MTIRSSEDQSSSLGSGHVMDDGKAPDAMRTIGEVSRALGIKQHVLRYWEDRFPSLKPVKRSGGRRLYRTEDVALLMRIDTLLNREGYTLRGAQQALASGPERAEIAAVPSVEAKPVIRSMGGVGVDLGDLMRIRGRLAEALARA